MTNHYLNQWWPSYGGAYIRYFITNSNETSLEKLRYRWAKRLVSLPVYQWHLFPINDGGVTDYISYLFSHDKLLWLLYDENACFVNWFLNWWVHKLVFLWVVVGVHHNALWSGVMIIYGVSIFSIYVTESKTILKTFDMVTEWLEHNSLHVAAYALFLQNTTLIEAGIN